MMKRVYTDTQVVKSRQGATQIQTFCQKTQAQRALPEHQRKTLHDDESLVRASAVLKSQGPENWPRGTPLGSK